MKLRVPLEDQDTNSQDSGISFGDDGKPSSQEFRFAQPSGFAPRRLTQESPRRSMASNLFSSSSSDSNDDGFMDFIVPVSQKVTMIACFVVIIYIYKFVAKLDLYISGFLYVFRCCLLYTSRCV